MASEEAQESVRAVLRAETAKLAAARAEEQEMKRQALEAQAREHARALDVQAEQAKLAARLAAREFERKLEEEKRHLVQALAEADARQSAALEALRGEMEAVHAAATERAIKEALVEHEEKTAKMLHAQREVLERKLAEELRDRWPSLAPGNLLCSQLQTRGRVVWLSQHVTQRTEFGRRVAHHRDRH